MERRVYRYETVGSTNTELTELIRQGAAEGTVVLARQQTAGRGRMGRSFQSPAGLGLYGSVLLRSSPEDAPRIPALAATAVRRAIRRSCGLSCGIKWPNDLVLSGRKVCGILAEALPGPEGSLWVVVGIGINVCQRREDFLPELRETAASLSMIAGAEIDRAALETAFLEELEALRRELPQETAERRQEYSAACLNLGRRVRVLRPGGTLCGCFYVSGACRRTDRRIRRAYEPMKFFPPPYETVDSLRERLNRMYSTVQLGNVRSIAWFVCRKGEERNV